MMTDQELLTYAAKAAGIEDKIFIPMTQPYGYYWNPLISAEDAFLLMVKLNMLDTMRLMELRLEETRKNPKLDDCQILQRSIVRAAAEIGKGM